MRRLSPRKSVSQVSGHHVDELRIGRRLAQLRTGDHIQKVMVELVPAALDQRAEIALHTTRRGVEMIRRLLIEALRDKVENL